MASNRPLYEMVYHEMLQRIQAGIYGQGDKLPSEKELEEAFGVSRITVKQAMNMLAKEGRIIRRPGLGSFVSEPEKRLVPQASGEKASGRLLGLVMEDFSPSYGLQLLLAIESSAGKLGYDLCIKRTLGDQEVEALAIESLVAAGVQGIIMMPTHGKSYNTRILKLVVEGFPLIFVDRYLAGIPAPFIGTDNLAATNQVMDALFALGHQNIAMITAPDVDATTISERITGYTTSYKRHGIVRNKDYILDDVRSSLPSQRGPDATQRDVQHIADFLQRYPDITAVLAGEYEIAGMVRKACAMIGKEIPEALSLACYDDVAPEYGGGYYAHVQQDEKAIGEKAVAVLHNRIAGEAKEESEVKIYFPAVWRAGQSVRKL